MYTVIYSTMSQKYCLQSSDWTDLTDLLECIRQQGFVTNLDLITRIEVFHRGIQVYDVQP